MDSAVEAVLSIVAPARPAPPRQTPAAGEETSFADHLAASEPETKAEVTDAEKEDADDKPAPEIIATAPAQLAPPPPAPLLMQLAVGAPPVAPVSAPEANQESVAGLAPPPQPTEQAPLQPPVQTAKTSERQAKAKATPAEALPVLNTPLAANATTTEETAAQQATPQPATTTAAAASPAGFNPAVAAAVAAINAVTQQSTAQQRVARAAATAKSTPAEQTPTATPIPQPQQAAVKASPAKAAADRLQAALKDTPIISPRASQPQTHEAAAMTAPTEAVTTHASSHANATGTEQAVARAGPAAMQVAREIVRRFDGGSTRFELRLDPPELGRVEVRLDVSRDHRVTAVIAADNPQSLMELARHARELEQQLQSAGLSLSENGLSFDLRQGARGDDSEARENSNQGGRLQEIETEDQALPARPVGLERWRGVRVDLMV